jgi:hypothetical protein
MGLRFHLLIFISKLRPISILIYTGISVPFHMLSGEHGSVVIEVLCYKPEDSGFDSQWGHWISLIYLILPATVGPGVYSASNRNEYQKHKKKILGSKRGRWVRLTTFTPSVSQLFRQCGFLNISQSYGPPRFVTGTALLSLFYLLSTAYPNKPTSRAQTSACFRSVNFNSSPLSTTFLIA